MRKALALLLLAACATPRTARPPPAPAPVRTGVRPGATPSALETALLADLSDHKLDGFPLLDAALIVSGARDPAELASARRWYSSALKPVVAGLNRNDPRGSARALLQSLHRGTRQGPAVLRQYRLEATSLLDVAETGSFNCVSATLLYVIAARELGLDVRAVLLPSHARAAFVHGGMSAIVETTIAEGFGAPPEASREIVRNLQQGAPANSVDLYADERGVPVDDLALLGSIYTNLSVAAKGRGDLAAAEALEARADLFVDESARPLLRRVRSTTLIQLSVDRYREGRLAEAMALGLQAAQLAPGGDEARVARSNLLALAMARLQQLAKGIDERAVFAVADQVRPFPEVAAEVRPAAWDIVGAIRTRAGDTAGAAAAYREAAISGAGSRNAAVFAHNNSLAELKRIAELTERDPERAWVEWQALRVPPGDEALEKDRLTIGAQIALRRALNLARAQRCAEAEKRIAEWLALNGKAPADAVRAECRGRVGTAKWQAGDFAAAADAFREASRLNPAEPAFRENLANSLKSRTDALLKQDRCAEAAPVIAEGSTLDGRDEFFRKAADFCARRRPR